eukprot:4892194-Pyramimonas_sp.AAC.1
MASWPRTPPRARAGARARLGAGIREPALAKLATARGPSPLGSRGTPSGSARSEGSGTLLDPWSAWASPP